MAGARQIIDTGSTISRREYEEMSGRVAAADHVRVWFDATSDGRRVRISCEVATDLEGRARRWCERQRVANRSPDAEIHVEPVYCVGRNGRWDDGARSDG